MNEIITINNYAEFEQKFDNVMQETAERFVTIGYLLKVARDTDILRESGYSTMGEFALKRYGLTKDITSRYIAINDRYSENGYSAQLGQRYRSFGYAKLAEMLTLPEVIVEEITPEMTKSDIRMIKEEYREEQSLSDIEVLLEEKDQEIEQIESMLQKVLFEALHENPEMFREMWAAVPDVEHMMEALAPSGMAVISCRIPGTGRLMLSIKGIEENLQVVNIRNGEKEEFTWQELQCAAEKLLGNGETWEEAFETVYGEAAPEKKSEVAPAQLQKVVRAKKPKERKKPEKEEKKATPKEESAEKEQLPGQMSVENFPETLPEHSAAAERSELYEQLAEEAQELAHGVHEVFWGWKEEPQIPGEELQKALQNAKELVGKIEKILEMTEEYENV